MAEKPLSSGLKWFLRWFFLGFGGKFVLKSVFVILKLWTEVPFLRCHVLRVFAIFWHLKTGTRDIRDFRQSILKDPQNGRAQNPSNTFTFWFESLYKSLKVSYHSFHKVNMSHGRNTRKIPDQVFQYPIIPDWLFIWCKYPYPIHTRTDPKYFFQYPIHTRPEVEKPYPSAPAPPPHGQPDR